MKQVSLRIGLYLIMCCLLVVLPSCEEDAADEPAPIDPSQVYDLWYYAAGQLVGSTTAAAVYDTIFRSYELEATIQRDARSENLSFRFGAEPEPGTYTSGQGGFGVYYQVGTTTELLPGIDLTLTAVSQNALSGTFSGEADFQGESLRFQDGQFRNVSIQRRGELPLSAYNATVDYTISSLPYAADFAYLQLRENAPALLVFRQQNAPPAHQVEVVLPAEPGSLGEFRIPGTPGMGGQYLNFSPEVTTLTLTEGFVRLSTFNDTLATGSFQLTFRSPAQPAQAFFDTGVFSVPVLRFD